jgi:hypothetical protein
MQATKVVLFGPRETAVRLAAAQNRVNSQELRFAGTPPVAGTPPIPRTRGQPTEILSDNYRLGPIVGL